MPTNRTASTAWRATRKAFIAAEKKRHPLGLLFCALCGKRVQETYAYTHPLALQVHHVVSPLDRPELEHVFSNLRITHRKCNRDEGRPGHGSGQQPQPVAVEKPKHDASNPRPGYWYGASGGGTTGFLNEDGFVVPVLPGLRLWLLNRWWTEEEAIEEQKNLRRVRAQRDPFRRD